uniref:RNA methyltransferase n=1 Tax=Lepisosteus oculatus TaxID=7918 RepID=W5N7Z5_LEPOC
RGGAGTHRRRRQQQQQQQRKFQYGNYNKYYGYRNPGWSEDPRVRVLRPEWFRGKAVLDLGCNTGHLTLTLAKNWQPARVTGLDIDGALVHAARQNVRHYLSELAAEEARQRRREGAAEQERGRDPGQDREQDHQQDREQEQDREGASLGNQEEEAAIQVQQEEQEEKRTGNVAEDSTGSQSRLPAPPAARHPFPISLRICRGPIAAPPVAQPAPSAPGDFPANVTFVQGNYVLPNDELLVSQKPEYDVILCLSMTKWVHLNWGDAGLQRLFKRVYRHLQPGGIFILEPQPWASYGKRKKLTETIYKNYYSIRFKPDQFSSYLTGPEVGFSSYELIGTPKSSSKGFQRPIYLFHKGPSSARK